MIKVIVVPCILLLAYISASFWYGITKEQYEGLHDPKYCWKAFGYPITLYRQHEYWPEQTLSAERELNMKGIALLGIIMLSFGALSYVVFDRKYRIDAPHTEVQKSCESEMAPVLNTDTNEVVQTPIDKIGPHMVRARIDGKDCWVDSRKLSVSEYKHPVFSGDRKDHVINIQKKIHDVYYKSYKDWEDGFRRDANPDQEIAIWEYIISIYESESSGYSGLEQRKEILQVAIVCSYSAPDIALNQVQLKTISPEKARSVIAAFYRK